MNKFNFAKKRPVSFLSLCSLLALAVSQPLLAEETSTDQPASTTMDMPDSGRHMEGHNQGTTPAGVHGADMLSAGSAGFSYTPMLMHMSNNYIGSSTVSPDTIVTTIPSQTNMNGMPEKYRIVPTSMDVQSHMFNFMYGISDRFNMMIMTAYLDKSMSMTTYSGASGMSVLGTSSSTTSGFGDTTVSGLWRFYKDSSNDANFMLGVSLPTGSNTENISMLSNMTGSMGMPMYMSSRGSYGMQLGTGTYDLLPGLTYTNHTNSWSWGTAWRGRFATGDNTEGYHYGDQNNVTAWGGYTSSPGLTWSARLSESVQNQIHGADPAITGLMEGTNPNFSGGKHTDVLAGVEVAGGPFGFKNKHLSLEAGKTVAQDLNGPQLGRDWMINASIGAGF